MDNVRIYRQFGMMMGAVLGLGFGLLIPIAMHRPMNQVLIAIALLFLVISITFPSSLKHVYNVWMKIGHVLGYINTRIILFIFFITILLPIGILLRGFGWDAMHRKLDREAVTYRTPSQPIAKNDLERPF